MLPVRLPGERRRWHARPFHVLFLVACGSALGMALAGRQFAAASDATHGLRGAKWQQIGGKPPVIGNEEFAVSRKGDFIAAVARQRAGDEDAYEDILVVLDIRKQTWKSRVLSPSVATCSFRVLGWTPADCVVLLATRYRAEAPDVCSMEVWLAPSTGELRSVAAYTVDAFPFIRSKEAEIGYTTLWRLDASGNVVTHIEHTRAEPSQDEVHFLDVRTGRKGILGRLPAGWICKDVSLALSGEEHTYRGIALARQAPDEVGSQMAVYSLQQGMAAQLSFRWSKNSFRAWALSPDGLALAVCQELEFAELYRIELYDLRSQVVGGENLFISNGVCNLAWDPSGTRRFLCWAPLSDPDVVQVVETDVGATVIHRIKKSWRWSGGAFSVFPVKWVATGSSIMIVDSLAVWEIYLPRCNVRPLWAAWDAEERSGRG